ncbi:MAG: alpha/beta hydrolase [Acidimicrobiia bacterium]
MRHIDTNGVTLAVDDRGDGYPVLFIHGFPELAYSWRHVAPVVADAGYRAISYDRRGTGESSGPSDVEAYALDNQVGDAIGILDRCGIDHAVFVGHDWGSIIAFAAALRYPDRVSHVVSLNVPYLGHAPGFPPTSVIRDKFKDRLGYVLTFLEPGVTEKRFNAAPDQWLQSLLAAVAGREGFITDEEFAYYRDSFVASGLSGQLNPYRNIDRNNELFADVAGAALQQPALMITTDRDPVLPAAMAEGMAAFAEDVAYAHIEDCGHWTQQERPVETSAIIVDWLDRRVRGHE